jgi:hypothetical protein
MGKAAGKRVFAGEHSAGPQIAPEQKVAGSNPAAGTTAQRPAVRCSHARGPVFGPATPKDTPTRAGPTRFALVRTAAPAGRMFRDEDGRKLFDLPESPRRDGDVPAGVGSGKYDHLLDGHHERRRIIPEDVPRHDLVTARPAAPLARGRRDPASGAGGLVLSD